MKGGQQHSLGQSHCYGISTSCLRVVTAALGIQICSGWRPKSPSDRQVRPTQSLCINAELLTAVLHFAIQHPSQITVSTNTGLAIFGRKKEEQEE